METRDRVGITPHSGVHEERTPTYPMTMAQAIKLARTWAYAEPCQRFPKVDFRRKARAGLNLSLTELANILGVESAERLDTLENDETAVADHSEPGVLSYCKFLRQSRYGFDGRGVG